MATAAVLNGRAKAPTATRRGWTRVLAAGVALGMAALLVGDRGLTANSVQGIDPLEILNLQVKPNVLFVVDSSFDMGFNPEGSHYVGGDDPRSRFYATKQALRELIVDNDGKANFGIVDMSADLSLLTLETANNGRRGPLVYVSADPQAAEWAPSGNGLFDDEEFDFNDYDGLPDCLLPMNISCSQEVFRSLENDDYSGPDAGGRHYMQSRLFRDGVKFSWDRTGVGNFDRRLQAIDTITCPPPPAGLLGDDTDEFNDGAERRACFQIVDIGSGSSGLVTTFYLTSPTYNGPTCDGVTLSRCLVAPVQACTAASNVTALLSGPLRLQNPLVTDVTDPRLGLPQDPSGLFTPTPPIPTELIGRQPNAAGGMQIGTLRPLGEALAAASLHYSAIFGSRPAAVAGLQRNFVIVIASGATTGGVNPVTQAASMRGATNPPGANDITTMVVSFNGQASFDASAAHTALNNLQSAGTLGRHTLTFGAATPDELRSSLNFAFSEAIATGSFSTESSITESIYEYVPLAGAFDPLDPASRYNGRVPVILQSSFDMPGFTGHLKAFINQGGVSTLKWDAGIRLLDRVWNGVAGDGICPGAWAYSSAAPGIGPTAAQMTACVAAGNRRTFDQLRGADPTAPLFTPTGMIKRRIFTTRANGVFPYDPSDFGDAFQPSAAQCPIPLWPPTSSTSLGGNCPALAAPVAPAVDATGGLFDEAMGLGGPDTPAEFARLQSEFSVCLGSPLPPVCTAAFPARTQRARREAREIVLAYTAGAQVASLAGIPRRDGFGEILYQARTWVLAESTLGVPAVVPPPLEARPLNHTAEYLLLRDGIRNSAGTIVANALLAGFGLRNPDKNANVPTGTANGTGNNGAYEPLMSTIYHAANDMLHAFRGGPCPGGTCSLSGGVAETGGEELYGFIPYDQLDKLPERLQGQGRSPHTFMLASSVRFSDVFVPGPWTDSNTGRAFQGVWRTVLVVGRGIAGQRYTALDITSPGQLNRGSLFTDPPFAIWSRGNPDVNCVSSAATCADGQPSGTPVRNTTGYTDDGANDTTAYAQMGETWSVPAMAAVPPVDFFNSEFAMFMGSGFSPNQVAAEGKTFYAVDSLTGDVLHAPTAPDTTNTCNSVVAGEVCPVPNALVANPAAYVAPQLAPNFVGNPSASTASLVYIGDLHGRMWKFMTTSPGLGLVKLQPDTDAVFADSPDQPIGSSAALLNLDNMPHVYWETGNDLRILPPDNFKFIAMADVGADVNPTSTQTDPAARLFGLQLNGALAGFRGTAQPATAFNVGAKGRVFFIGTKFNDQDVSGGNCKSNFDSVLFAVGASTGNAVYDLDSSGSVTASDVSVMLSGTKVNALRASMGQIVLDKGDIGSNPPPLPPAPAPASNANEGSSGEVIVNRMKSGSAVCR